MTITKVAIRNFKRFSDATFDLGGYNYVVVAGPNNSGKTTLLQAIATWHSALRWWWGQNNYHRRGGVYAKAPMPRQSFSSVPLRTASLLWHQRDVAQPIVIEVTFGDLRVPVEISRDSAEQFLVRPGKDVDPLNLQHWDAFPQPVLVPAMTGLGPAEPVYQPPKIEQLLGEGRSGDVLRNLLYEAHLDEDFWDGLTASIKEIFGYVLLPPNAYGPNIIAEYQHRYGGERYDLASAGSGFLQVLMLLIFLRSRPVVLLLDEPDAHLHGLLQDRIYSLLRAKAQASRSQLIISTHSDILINSADPRELCVLSGKPGRLAEKQEEAELILSLPALSNQDISLARDKGCVLYVKGRTDLELLCIWARTLGHRSADFLEQPFWKSAVFETRPSAAGTKAEDHFEALQLVGEEIRGVQIIDREGRDEIPSENRLCAGKLLRLCWNRYEIENYLLHPDALARFVGEVVGPEAVMAQGNVLKGFMRAQYLPEQVVDKPMQNHHFLNRVKASRDILAPLLHPAGRPNFPCTRYTEIARVMRPDEIHPEVKEKLDALAEHLNL